MTSHDVGAEPRILTAKGQATRDRIVATAATLMFESGVTGTARDHFQRPPG